MFCLGVGLVGLCMVLLTVMDTLFADWDVSSEFRMMMRKRRVFMRHLLEGHSESAYGQSYERRVNAYGRPTRIQHSPVEYAAQSLPAPVEAGQSREPANV